MSRIRIVMLAVLVFAAGAYAQPGGYHEDEQTGYKVRFPAGWLKMPIKVEDKWMVAKYLSDKEYFGKESYGFKPEMRVIIFPHAVTKDRGVSKTEREEGESKVTTLRIKNPYKDYMDYMDRNYSGGGWSVSLEEEQTAKNHKWTLVEIKVEKLTWGGKKRIITGIFHQEDGDFAVHFEILESSYKKLKPTVYGCLKSFQFIGRKGSLSPATTGDGEEKDEDDMTPAERKKFRHDRQASSFKKAVESAPDGWKSFESKGFLVIYHVDKKYAMKVVKQCEAIRKWLEKTFPYMGDEYVRPAIIRICENWDEEKAYREGSGDAWGSSTREITTHKDQSAGSASSEFEWVNRRIVSGWFYDKDKEFVSLMPDWVRNGLGQYVGTASLKGAKLQFKPDTWENDSLREAERKGELQTVQTMLKMSSDEFKYNHMYQSAALLRFLLDGPGRGIKGAKTFLEDYFIAMRRIAVEKKKEEEANRGKAREGPKTEEEEEEEFKNRRKKWKEAEKQILQEVYQRAFPDWSEAMWKKLEASFKRYIS